MTFTQLLTQEEISNVQKASLVSNTEQNTSKWLRVVDHFNKSCGITNSIEQIDPLKDLENYLCQFITWLQKEDSSDYKLCLRQEIKSVVIKISGFCVVITGLENTIHHANNFIFSICYLIDVKTRVRVIDVFATPQSGTGVSVEAVDPKMLDMLKQTGRPEMV
ncbi:6345_t:CDS:2, partial [Funneliformis mosseae]